MLDSAPEGELMDYSKILITVALSNIETMREELDRQEAYWKQQEESG